MFSTAILKACHIETKLKLIPFTHVNFSPEFNILCEREFGSSKKKFSIPTFLGSKKKINPYLPYPNFCGSETPNKVFFKTGLTVSPDSNWLVVDYWCYIHLLFILLTGLIRCVTVSPDSNWLAVGYSTGVVSILDIRTGLLLASWKGHEGEVLQVCYVTIFNPCFLVHSFKAINMLYLDT